MGSEGYVESKRHQTHQRPRVVSYKLYPYKDLKDPGATKDLFEFFQKNEGPLDFSEDDFKAKQGMTVENLCAAIKQDGYELPRFRSSENTVKWLNDLLEVTGLYEVVISKKSNLEFTEEILKLEKETMNKRGTEFAKLTSDEQKTIKRLNRSMLELVYPQQCPKCQEPDRSVGIMYFAPFLKEKFSGEENYFNFLITEFYRFQEFSTVMPVSIIAGNFMGGIYYVLFSTRNGYWLYGRTFTWMFILILLLTGLYMYFITRDGMVSYARSRQHLVQGVPDLMKKNLIK